MWFQQQIHASIDCLQRHSATCLLLHPYLFVYCVLQGWRLEVPSLPRLAEVGAFRGTPPSIVPLPSSHSNSSSATTASQPDSSSNPQEQQQQQMQEDQPPVDQQQQQREGTPSAAAAAASAASICRRAVPTAAAYHGGYYSTADVAAVVAYAAERCIQVVPEVELPGHCCAALAAYPNLSCEYDCEALCCSNESK
jgi:N-acetyl-beta-hexosaminidase